MGHGLRRCIASGDQYRFLRRLNDRGRDAILLAIETGIGHIDVPMKNDLGRDDLDLLLNLSDDGLHDPAAFRALTLFLGKRVLDLYDLNILRKNIPCPAGLPLAGMRAHLDRRLPRFLRVFGIGFRLIEQQTELADNLLRSLLGGRAELLAFQHAQLLKKPLVLRLQLFAFRSGPVTDDIGNMAKIQLFYVGFGQTHGLGLAHNDGKQALYCAHP